MFEHYAAIADDDLDIIEVVLAFAALAHEGISLERYRVHFQVMGEQVEARFQDLLEAGSQDDAGTRLAALHDVIVLDKEYRSIVEVDADPMVYTDMIEVVERRAGLPVMLAVIFVAVGRSLGWALEVLDIGGVFVCRLEHDGQRLMFDPGDGCRLLQAHDLREMLKAGQGEEAELSADYFEPVANRDWMLAVQSLMMRHMIRMEDYEGALARVQAMQFFAPEAHRLLLDAGVLYARTRQREAAMFALEHYIAKEDDPRLRHEALSLLNDLRDMSD